LEFSLGRFGIDGITKAVIGLVEYQETDDIEQYLEKIFDDPAKCECRNTTIQIHVSFFEIAYARTQTSWLQFKDTQEEWIDMNLALGLYRMKSVDSMLHIMKIVRGDFKIQYIQLLPSVQNKIIYYHVATYENCNFVISDGISPTGGRPQRDFGPGFYVTTSEELANFYISHLLKAQLLIFAIPANHGLVEITLDQDTWKTYVYNNLVPSLRSGTDATLDPSCDFVSGWHSGNYHDVIKTHVRPTPSTYPQSCLKSHAATVLWCNNLLAIVEFTN